MEITAALAKGFFLDVLLGDPQGLPHPVRVIGYVITRGERLLYSFSAAPACRFVQGMFLSLLVLGVAYAIPWLLLSLAGWSHPVLRLVVHSLLCYQMLAAKSLEVESMRVYESLVRNDLEDARKNLSWIVGRDTESLDGRGIIRAAVESVSENTSDGVVAPMIFMALGGAPLCFLYKAANTLDSMIGYRNEKYLYFGKFAARLDDILNYIPAVISAYLMMAAGFFLNLDVKNAFRIYRRDRFHHASPNSAKTESVCAGALNIQLGGDSLYAGKRVEKETIGDALREPVTADILTANRLMRVTSVLALAVLLSIRLLGGI